MKKMTLIFSASLLFLMVFQFSNVSACSDYITCGGDGSSERIVVAEYSLTPAQTADIAANIEAINGPAGSITSAGAEAGARTLSKYLVGSAWSGIGVVFLAAELSANAQDNVDIRYAAQEGKGVNVVMTDLKNYSTSYSKQLEFTVAD